MPPIPVSTGGAPPPPMGSSVGPGTGVVEVSVGPGPVGSEVVGRGRGFEGGGVVVGPGPVGIGPELVAVAVALGIGPVLVTVGAGPVCDVVGLVVVGPVVGAVVVLLDVGLLSRSSFSWSALFSAPQTASTSAAKEMLVRGNTMDRMRRYLSDGPLRLADATGSMTRAMGRDTDLSGLSAIVHGCATSIHWLFADERSIASSTR